MSTDLATLRALVERHEKGVVMYEVATEGSLSSFTRSTIPGARAVRLIKEPTDDA